jgi:ubiquinone biosynthesis protein UbiJ
MTDIEQQIEQQIDMIMRDDPAIQSALRTLRAQRCAADIDAMLYAITVTVTKQFSAMLLGDGYSIDQVNAMLPSFISEVEQWREQTLSEVLRSLDEPDAARSLQ